MKKLILAAFSAASFALAGPVQAAQNITVEVTNLTHAMFFTPLFIAAHEASIDTFQLGDPATDPLRDIAEGGDRAAANAFVTATRGVSSHTTNEENDAVAAGGTPPFLAPGETQTAQFRINNRKKRLSILSMILPSNDGFVGGDSIALPRKGKTKTVFIRAYDAGTEANNELIVDGSGAPGTPGIPGDPGGNSVTGSSGLSDGQNTNSTVHNHRGITGGFSSDLNEAVHGWKGAVAKVVITVR